MDLETSDLTWCVNLEGPTFRHGIFTSRCPSGGGGGGGRGDTHVFGDLVYRLTSKDFFPCRHSEFLGHGVGDVLLMWSDGSGWIPPVDVTRDTRDWVLQVLLFQERVK